LQTETETEVAEVSIKTTKKNNNGWKRQGIGRKQKKKKQ
jgi:hypothetical protein